MTNAEIIARIHTVVPLPAWAYDAELMELCREMYERGARDSLAVMLEEQLA